jgi:hypothetical protein
MNERIRELADQAESYANSKIHMTGWNYREEYNKKFAELLIQECASAVNSRDDSDTGFWANVIKQHFGVEE